MNVLDTDRISRRQAYKVWYEDGQYLFHTDFGIAYAVAFDKDDTFDITPAYWFGLTNHSDKASPNDPKVRATVICIIEEFFRVNPDILLYMCDNANEQQAMRQRLFLRWFNGYEQQKKYCIQTAFLIDEDVETYVALIAQRNNPHLKEIVDRFNSEIAMFQESKP